MFNRLLIISLLILSSIATISETETIRFEKDTVQKIRLVRKFEKEHQIFYYPTVEDPPYQKDYIYVPRDPNIFEL